MAYHYESEILMNTPSKDPSTFHPTPTWWSAQDSLKVSPGVVYHGSRKYYDRQLFHLGTETRDVAIEFPGEKQLLLAGSLFLHKALGIKPKTVRLKKATPSTPPSIPFQPGWGGQPKT
jgi:hypothetical protein